MALPGYLLSHNIKVDEHCTATTVCASNRIQLSVTVEANLSPLLMPSLHRGWLDASLHLKMMH